MSKFEIESNNRLLKVFSLLNKFIKKENEFIVYSLDLYLNRNFSWREIYSTSFYQEENPSLKIYFSEANVKFEIEKEFYGIPVFPKIFTPYYKLYQKLIEFYWNVKIDFIILCEEDYKTLTHHYVEQIWKIQLLNLKYYIENSIQQFQFELSAIKKNSFFASKDAYYIIFRLELLFRFLKFYNSERVSQVFPFFAFLDEIFWRSFLFQSTTSKEQSCIGTARILFDDILSISDQVVNLFNKGDIIVASNTSVSYMKYLVNCWGIITINGNKLSHASLIARELNVPLILWADDVFMKIFDGDTIRVDAKTWEVEVLQRFWEN